MSFVQKRNKKKKFSLENIILSFLITIEHIVFGGWHFGCSRVKAAVCVERLMLPSSKRADFSYLHHIFHCLVSRFYITDLAYSLELLGKTIHLHYMIPFIRQSRGLSGLFESNCSIWRSAKPFLLLDHQPGL